MVATWKEKLVKDVEAQLLENPVVGVVNLESLPLQQLQQMRAQLRKRDVAVLGGRKKLFELAIDNASKKKPGIEKLKEYCGGIPALIFAKSNPFTLYKELQKSKTPAPARAGQVAPKDIVIPAGPTPFAPGPIIAELSGAGIVAGVDGGKVAIKKDSTPAKAGDVISAQLAALLTRLDIKPMEIGLNIQALFEEGQIYTQGVLAIDEDEYLDNITTAARQAFNLAMNAGVMTDETTEFMLIKAFTDSKALARECNILADAVVDEILAKAHTHMQSVSTTAKIDEAFSQLGSSSETSSADDAQTSAEAAIDKAEDTQKDAQEALEKNQ